MKHPITFAAFGKQVKKLFVLWLVLAIVTGLAVMGLHLPSLSARSSAYAVVNFGFDGIQSGMDPNGSWFDVNEMKSTEIVAAGAEAAGMTLAEGEAEQIASHISISATIPEKVINEMTNLISAFTKDTLAVTSVQKVNDYYPTRYAMTLEFGELGYDRETGNKLLQGMLDAYRKQFFEKYGYNEKLENLVKNTDYFAYDYANALTVMDSNLNLLIRYAKALAAEDGTGFRSSVTGVTFQDLATGFQVLQDQDLSSLSSYISSHNVSRDLTQLRNEYAYRIETEQRNVKALEERTSSLTELINRYVKTKGIVLTTSGGNSEESDSSGAVEVTQSSAVYDSLIQKRISLQTEMAESNTVISRYKTLLENMTGDSTAADRTYVEDEIARISTRFSEMLNSFRQTAEDYYDNKKLTDAFTILMFEPSSAFPLRELIMASAVDAVGAEALLLGIFVLVAVFRATREEKKKHQGIPAAGENI